jgi:hypothetical protein
MFEACRSPPLLKPHDTAIVDSGCNGHSLLVNAPCLNKVKSQTPLMVRLPNGATMESSHTDELNIPHLNAAASIAHVFHGMSNHSLLLFGRFCNEGYVVTFKDALVTVCNSQKFQILSGPWDLDTRLWRINLKQDNQQIHQPVANNVYELCNTGALVHYLQKPCSAQRSLHCYRRSKRTSRNLARPNRRRHPQTFEAHAGHRDGEHESKMPEHKVNFESTNWRRANH